MGPSDVILLNENGSARCSAKIGSAKITILITNNKVVTMDEDNNEEYFRTLITQPPHSDYNKYDNQKCVPETVLEPVFCETDDGNCSTESEVSVLVSSQPNG